MTPEQCKPLLDFIAQYEADRRIPNMCNSVWLGIPPKARPARDPVDMTIREVMQWQDSLRGRYASSAIGAWQFIRATLREFYAKAGLTPSDPFNEENQRKLAVALLKRRGLQGYLAGEMTTELFALHVAKEWASMPVPFDTMRGSRPVKRGQSYYAGDGLNAAHAPLGAYLAAIEAIKAPVAPPAVEAPQRSIWAVLGDLLARLFRRGGPSRS